MQPRFFVILAVLSGMVAAIWGLVTLIGVLTAPRPAELPGGGREIFPTYRLFGYSGYPGAASLGRLGTGDIDERMAEMVASGAEYARDRKLLPVMELIAVTVHGTPGSDGMYRTRVSDDIVAAWLETARRHQALLLLNIQPGRSAMFDEVRYFEKWLTEPDVGLALDPEWAVGPDEVPGRVFGHTSGQELDAIAGWVSELVARHDLPEKVLLYHQLHEDIVTDEDLLEPAAGVVFIKSVDGIGTAAAKTALYRRIAAATPEHVHLGFKLFFEEDARHGALMTPAEVMALTPEPVYVLWE